MDRLFALFKKIESNKDAESKISFVIAGLGNYGEKYRHTRHNAGFLALSYMAQRTAMESKGKLLVTTTGETAPQSEIDALLGSLQSAGMEAGYLPAIDTSAEALAALKDSDSVLFAVSTGKSKVPDILAAKALAEQTGKTAVGYVML